MRTYTGTFTQGNVTYNYEAVMPEELTFIYSRHVFVYVRLTDSGGKAVPGVRLQMVLQLGTSMNTNEYRYTDSSGMVRFDIAAIMQMMTDSRESDISNIEYRSDRFTSWTTSMFRIQLYKEGVGFLAVQSQYVNGSHFNAKNWWANERRLKWWSSYPFTFDFVNTPTVRLSENGGMSYNYSLPYTSSTLKLINRVNPLVLKASTQTRTMRIASDVEAEFSRAFSSAFSIYENKAGWAIIDGLVTTPVNSVVTLEVDNCPPNERKTYLRWLGRHGEVFYWLFGNKTETTQVKSERYRMSAAEDTFRGVETNKILDNGVLKDATCVTQRTIYTELTGMDYYDYIVQMAESPYVDMYLGDDKWQRVDVVDASYTKDMKAARNARSQRLVFTIEIGG